MFFPKIHALAFAVCAVAGPIDSVKRHDAGFSRHLITFDGLQAVIAAPALTPLTTVQNIKFTSFDLLEAGVPGTLVAGVQPQSQPNTAVTSALTGQINNVSSISIGPKIRSFGLDSMYFGCVLQSAVSALGVATSCTVAFTAFKKDQTAPAETVNIAFNAPNVLDAPMVKAVFPHTFNELERVDIALVSEATASVLTALLIDNVAVTECTTH